MAAGASGETPPATSSSVTFGKRPVLRKSTIVAPCAASARRLSASGTAVLPAARVTITVCETSGSVYSVLSAAAAPERALTPGVTSYSMPRASKARICSPIAP